MACTSRLVTAPNDARCVDTASIAVSAAEITRLAFAIAQPMLEALSVITKPAGPPAEVVAKDAITPTGLAPLAVSVKFPNAMLIVCDASAPT